MTATLLFVHGTGVRGAKYAATLKQIEHGARRWSLPVAVTGCFWGDAEGAKLRAAGSSVPSYPDTGGTGATEAEQVLALWAVLYTDPWYELRLLRHLPTTAQPLFGAMAAPEALRHVIDELTPSDELLTFSVPPRLVTPPRWGARPSC
jgi:hypothetical protein